MANFRVPKKHLAFTYPKELIDFAEFLIENKRYLSIVDSDGNYKLYQRHSDSEPYVFYPCKDIEHTLSTWRWSGDWLSFTGVKKPVHRFIKPQLTPLGLKAVLELIEVGNQTVKVQGYWSNMVEVEL